MLEEWIRNKNGERDAKNFLYTSKMKYLLVALISLGILALIWPATQVTPNEQIVANNPTPKSSPVNIESSMVQELESILAQIDGVGTVNVSLSLSSEGTKSYASNIRDEKRDIQETDVKGLRKNTSEQSITRDLAVSSGNPLLIEEKRPEILGVLVVAGGASDSQIAEYLTNATATLLNISPHKVTVMPRKGGE